MVEIIGRLRLKNKEFEILVDSDKAIEFKKNRLTNIRDVLISDEIFYDIKKGLKASEKDLNEFFGTSNIYEIAERIIKEGRIEIPEEYRKKELEQRKRQIVDFLSKNTIDPRTNNPYTPETIRQAIKQASVKIENRPVEEQIENIIKKLRSIIPIKIESKRLLIRIPAQHTGKAYSLIHNFSLIKEEWLSNGDLEVTIEIPSGMQLEFYDKLNKITHGTAETKEIKTE